MERTGMNKLAIIGAGGHGRVIADIARKNGYNEIEFLDDNENVQKCGDYPVVGKCCEAEKIDADVIVAIGDKKIRKQITATISDDKLVTLIHPNATVAENVIIGRGTVVMAGAVINPGAVIGAGCIINTCSSVDHDCSIGDYVHVAVGSHLCGAVSVGNETLIGAGAMVVNNINITSDCIVGAGTVVIRDIKESGTYVGVPARKMTPNMQNGCVWGGYSL